MTCVCTTLLNAIQDPLLMECNVYAIAINVNGVPITINLFTRPLRDNELLVAIEPSRASEIRMCYLEHGMNGR